MPELHASSEPVAVQPHRLQLQDLFVLKPWLFDKLRQRWMDYTDRTFVGWLQSYIAASSHCCFCTKDALAVCVLQADIRDPLNYAELLYVVHNPGFLTEALACVTSTVEWARRQGAKEFRFTRDGDVPQSTLIAHLGAKDKDKRVTHIVPIGVKA